MTHEEAAAKIEGLVYAASKVQSDFGRLWDGPSDMLLDCFEGLATGTHFLNQDIVILRGMISARSHETTPYHEAIVPVMQEALEVLESLSEKS